MLKGPVFIAECDRCGKTVIVTEGDLVRPKEGGDVDGFVVVVVDGARKHLCESCWGRWRMFWGDAD